jgi:transposase-like protein
MTAARAVPFYCPYCGEEDLRPEEEPQAAWWCADCQRVFVVRLVGLLAPGREVAG